MSMPPGAPEPDPTAAPTPPPHAAPPPPLGQVPPPPGYVPSTGYTAPVQPSYSGLEDPLVPAGSDFNSWFAKVQEVGKRSWRSALFTTGLGIAVPLALATLIRYAGGFSPTLSLFSLGAFFDVLGSVFLGAIVTLAAYIGVAFVASAGWAAGTWALVHEANTGQPANIGAAFQYGFKRAGALWLWAVITGAAFFIGSFCFVGALYVAFAASMFGFVGIFERGQNPLGRSFSMTHADFGPSLGKILLCFVPYFLVSLIVGLIFGAIALALAFGNVGGFGYNVSFGIIQAIGTLVQAVGLAALLIGLLPTYAQLRRREGVPVTTAHLTQELGG
jgi:hypothetical protein